MLDKKTQMMLEVANQLTTEDLALLRTGTPIVPNSAGSTPVSAQAETPDCAPEAVSTAPPESLPGATSRGEYERNRTRESKISTACVGQERAKHNWWPVGTQLVGRIGGQVFTAEAVENSHVKSGRGLLITCGASKGRVCVTPTRAALEATETYRQANNLGRGGGVTNGWTFWKPRQSRQSGSSIKARSSSQGGIK